MTNLGSHLGNALRNLFRKPQVEADLDDEIQAYIDTVVEEKIAAGMSAAEARRTVLAEFGGITQVKQSVRDHRAGIYVERLWLEFRYGLRQMRHNPGFAITVIITLALSIGANTAIFSVVNALMLRSLPYAHPERMGTIYTRVTGPAPSDERHHVNGEQWQLLRDKVPSLVSAISGIRASGVNLRTGNVVEYVRDARVSAHYFDVLALEPLVGRNFTEEEDRPNGPDAVILSYSLWHRQFAASPHVIGKVVLLKGAPYTVVGVLPQDASTPANADIYTPLRATFDGEGGGTNFEAITRLRDGTTWQQADAELAHAWALRTRLYELDDSRGATLTYHSVPLQKGETATLRPQVLALMAAAGLILLIACANLAGLTLVRTLGRSREVATRLALGASRWQIQRQLWIESLTLAIVGGIAGTAAGYAALRGLLLLLPEHFLPVASVSLDKRVLSFTLLLTIATSVLFGMVPALVTRRFDLRSATTDRTATGGDRLRLRQSLIVFEVALTVVLLAAAGLLIRTLIHLETLPPGFNPDGVMTARLTLDDTRYHDPAVFQKLLDESILAMRQIPGVRAAAVGLSLPYERSLIMGGIEISDGKEAGQKVMADEVYVTPDYFSTLQIPLLSGRTFTSSDTANTQHVAMVNRSFVRKFFHSENPVGRYLNKDTRIVGVVENVAMAPGIDAVAPLLGEETMYVPAAQVGATQLSFVHLWFQPSWIVRGDGPIPGLTGQMQRSLSSVDPLLPFSGFYSMHDLLAKTLATQRIEVALLSTAAGLALLLSAVGIFALVASIVAQKSRETGIRIALGSTIGKAMLQVGSSGIIASIVGLLTGLSLCAVGVRAMHSVVYGVGLYDMPTAIAVIVVLISVSAFATILPTLRIARIDPARTLREE
jgi:predicted permease